MSIEINELLNQCKEKLERNLVSSALQQLYDAYYLEDISKSEDIKLMRTRLLGHLGEYSEVFRSINEIRFEPGTSTTYQSYATIWAGVYWSRLGESEKALKIFESIQPQPDPEYLVLHWGHLLTIAIELGDKDLGETILKKTDTYKKKVKSSEIDWKELGIWEYILSPISKGKLTKDTVDKIVSKVYELKNSMDKKLFNILVCPICKGKLVYRAESHELICKFDRVAYPIRDDIPVMLESDARLLPLDEVEQL